MLSIHHVPGLGGNLASGEHCLPPFIPKHVFTHPFSFLSSSLNLRGLYRALFLTSGYYRAPQRRCVVGAEVKRELRWGRRERITSGSRLILM